MMNYKKIGQCLVVAVIFLYSSGCSQNSEDEIVNDVGSSIISSNITYEEDDAYQEVDEASVTTINLDEQNGDVQIDKAGTYILSGTLQDGTIRISVSKEETVRLVLQNAIISSSNFAGIYCAQAKKVIISLPSGTVNSISDGTTYEGVVDEEPSAAIFAKDSMSINGTGTLHVTGNHNDAITSKDTLKIIEGTYVLTAVDDGIVGRDALYVHSGSYQINAGGDGLKTTYDTDDTKGDMWIEGGDFKIVAGNDGVQSEHNLTIYDGTFTIETGGGSINGSTSANVNQPGGFGMWQETTTQEDTASAKGIKAGTSLSIAQGSYALDTSDDSIHSNETIILSSGNYVITSGDDGVHADMSVQIDGGNIDIQKSYEGIESAIININAGDIQIKASDDGINAGGGNDGSSTNGRPGENSFSGNSDIALNIHGGILQVDASGDGLDSNGTITMDGGTVVVSGSSNSGNGALDYGSEFTMDGGILIATGMSGMAQGVSASSSQNSIMVNLSATQEASSTFYISDETGSIKLGVSPVKSYNSVLISAPSLTSDATVSAYTNGTGGSVNDAGYIDGECSGGTLVDSVTLQTGSSTIGNAGMGGQGGGQMGGMRR